MGRVWRRVLLLPRSWWMRCWELLLGVPSWQCTGFGALVHVESEFMQSVWRGFLAGRGVRLCHIWVASHRAAMRPFFPSWPACRKVYCTHFLIQLQRAHVSVLLP